LLANTVDNVLLYHVRTPFGLFAKPEAVALGSLKTASVDESGWHDSNAGGGTTDGKFIEWLTISDQGKSVLADVQRIRSNSMVPTDIPIYGYIYDCSSGSLIEVPEATEVGKAS
jgi:carbonic anhydrase